MIGLHALVLAAGRGSRFGGGKLMTPWRGGVLLDGALAAALAAPVDSARVVTGADPAVGAYVRGRGLAAVACADFAQGLSASLKAGIAGLPPDARGALVFLGDMPLVPHGMLSPLAQALDGGATAAVPQWEGRIGHPAAISAALFGPIMTLKGDRGARVLLEGLGPALVRIEAPDAGVLLDVDRREDLPP